MNGSGTLFGTLRSWRDSWGFVVCPEAFQGDLFLHRGGFVGGSVPAGVQLQGASVRFERGVDSKGRAHAKNVVLLQASPPAAAPAPAAAAGGRAGAAAPPSRGRASAPGAAAAGLWGGGGGGGSTGSRASPEQLLPLVGQRLRGEIRSWREEWGFVVCPQRFHGDLFAHRESLRLSGAPAPGMRVSFQVQVDSRGRTAAAEISEAGAAAEDFVGHGRLAGQIRSWKQDWGFLLAPDFFEGDLFCHQDSLKLSWEPTRPGQLEEALPGRAASFEVVRDKRGRICASGVVPDDGSPLGGSPAGAAPGDASEPLEGTLRSWKDPWGFIVCPESFAGDLFVHRDAFVDGAAAHVSGLEGARVGFRRAVDPKGRAHATEVRVVSPGPAAASAAAACGGAVPEKFQAVVGAQLEGTVRSWKDDWGFVVCPEAFEGDLFMHRGNLGLGAESLAPGTRLSFQVSVDSKGRATAVAARCLSEASEWAGTGQELRGTIRSWKEQWGFVVSPGGFTGDLFCHLQYSPALRLAPPRSGMEVAFRVEVDPKGRATAVDLRPVPHGTRRQVANSAAAVAPDAKRPRLGAAPGP